MGIALLKAQVYKQASFGRLEQNHTVIMASIDFIRRDDLNGEHQVGLIGNLHPKRELYDYCTRLKPHVAS
ncbi:hypothetical protein Plhal304r1_c024g0081121 [Plasmopara halstedii]